uniref:Uncharacterized protein n=1 Tax=Oryza sativa subsp. japonica TaxID=39947 RepID=Q67U15_ORYSJ|nr:hypothetical protein [Oryza sativa Japonica Group]BAD38356.1 hypothetical protein [Oryza sativa Japonica Group]
MSGWGGEAWLDGRSDRRQALRQKGNQSMEAQLRGEPLDEGAEVRAKEGVGVDGTVVRPELRRLLVFLTTTDKSASPRNTVVTLHLRMTPKGYRTQRTHRPLLVCQCGSGYSFMMYPNVEDYYDRI